MLLTVSDSHVGLNVALQVEVAREGPVAAGVRANLHRWERSAYMNNRYRKERKQRLTNFFSGGGLAA